MVILPLLFGVSRQRVHASTKGFTLIELVVVVAVIGILTVIAVPAFNQMIATSRAKTTATNVYLALTKARSSAAKFNTSVAICRIGSAWENGWNIDYPACGGSRISTESASPPNVAITAPASVTYNTSGRATGAQFVIKATAGSASECRDVTVDSGGRPYAKKVTCP